VRSQFALSAADNWSRKRARWVPESYSLWSPRSETMSVIMFDVTLFRRRSNSAKRLSPGHLRLHWQRSLHFAQRARMNITIRFSRRCNIPSKFTCDGARYAARLCRSRTFLRERQSLALIVVIGCAERLFSRIGIVGISRRNRRSWRRCATKCVPVLMTSANLVTGGRVRLRGHSRYLLKDFSRLDPETGFADRAEKRSSSTRRFGPRD